MENRKPILEIDAVNFMSRFLESVNKPWVILLVGILLFISYYKPFIWIFILIFILIFIIMNFRAMRVFITRIEINEGLVVMEYLYYNDSRTLKTPIKKLNIEHYGNGIGLTSLVSAHIRIGKQGSTLLKQYETKNWSLAKMKSMIEKIKTIAKTVYN